MNALLRILALAALLHLAGCGFAALPGRATRPVTDADLLGSWTYEGAYGRDKVLIRFDKGYTFTQTIVSPGSPARTQRGTWTLSGPNVEITDVLIYDHTSTWTPYNDNWWFADGYYGKKLELMGGDCRDPDSAIELKRVVGPPAGPAGP